MRLHEVYRRAELALRLGASTYTIQLCELLLRYFPGDPRARTLLGLASLEDGQTERARQQLDLALEYDPEDAAALAALGVVHSTEGRLGAAVRAFERAYELNPGNAEARDSLLRLAAQRDGGPPDLPAAPPVAVARWRLRHDRLDTALNEVNALLVRQPGQIYLSIAKAEALWRNARFEDAERTCRQLLTRHPRLLKPRFILGQILAADPHREVEGVELLHLALADDPEGRAARALGADDRLAVPLYGDEIDLPTPDALSSIPPELASAIELAPVDPPSSAEAEWEPPTVSPGLTESKPLPTAVADSAAAVEAAPTPTAPVASAPVDLVEHLVVVSTRAGIAARFGAEGYERIDRRLQSFRRELAELGTNVAIAVLDDPISLNPFEVAPAASSDPGELKRVIDQVIARIEDIHATEDPRIGLLILGGDEIVPFHRLPNPADDDDLVVVTDAPYAASPDDRFFRPNLPIGRIPDSAGSNLTALLRSLDAMVEARRRPRLSMAGPGFLRAGLSALGALGRNLTTGPAFASGVAEWGPVISEVIGGLAVGASIRLSPPVTADDFNVRWLSDRRFLHFTLHGDASSGAWYGQPDEDEESEAPVLPVALEPEQITGAELVGPVVFCDVSYALNVAGRGASQSLALRFLSEGAAAVIGPTARTYGSPQLPLDGADLLAYLFWSELRKGATTGEALLLAKHRYVERAIEQRGYLDGEDQKLLLQYVLYGDPLLAACEEQPDNADDLPTSPSEIPILCNHASPNGTAEPLAPRQLRTAMEQIVAYCPGVGARAIRVQRRCRRAGDSDPPDHSAWQHDRAEGEAGDEVTTVSARLELATATNARIIKIARVTLDAHGAVQKILVSR